MNQVNYILKSNAIFTATGMEPISGAIAVKNNRIVAVGQLDDMNGLCGDSTQVIDCGDKLIMPGFNDAHMHFPHGAVDTDPSFCINLMDCKSEEECVEYVAQFAKENPNKPWIYGVGWSPEVWDKPHIPSKKSLDSLGLDRPIFLNSFDRHSVWCNSIALDRAGITRDTPQPNCGEIGLDENGEPNGILSEFETINPMADMVFSDCDIKPSLLKLLATFRELGITAIADVHPTIEKAREIYKEMELEGDLTCRVSMFADLIKIEDSKNLRKRFYSDKVRVGGLKQFLDGVVEIHTAYLTESYADKPNHYGTPIFTQEEINKHVLNAEQEGFAVKLHTIGDKAVTLALNAYENAQKVLGEKGLHHSVEHIDTINEKDINRMAGLNVLASVQPLHTYFGLVMGGYNAPLGKERLAFSWPYREILDAGAKLALSTDFPAVYSLNPILSIHGAVTRSTPILGETSEGMNTEHTITLHEALIAYTRDAAYAETFESDLGTLEPGKLADIVVLDRNLFDIDPMDIKYAQVDMTIFDGVIVYNREVFAPEPKR
ncbi:amidohydrolase [Bacillus paramycoides]|uniref:amidohydrolase n=1 Tax=Bacillus paramycoides TaxID=2026194 RepID=UPI003D042497